jgi:hypothetical protein
VKEIVLALREVPAPSARQVQQRVIAPADHHDRCLGAEGLLAPPRGLQIELSACKFTSALYVQSGPSHTSGRVSIVLSPGSSQR